MSDGTYNGWTNWATWQINLWLDNEEPWYRAKQSFIRYWGVDRLTEDKVNNFCEDTFGKKATPDMEESDWNDVNWSEILEHFVEEAKEYE